MTDISKINKFKSEAEWKSLERDDLNGVEFLIAPLENKEHQAKTEKLIKPHRRKFRRGSMDRNTMEIIGNRALIATVLLDWKGLKNQGQPFPFNEANAYELLMAPNKISDDIIEIAGAMAEEVAEENAEDEANVGESSSGNASGEAN